MFRTMTLADAITVANNMRAEDLSCLTAVTTINEPEAFALNRYQTTGPAWTLVDGTPVAIGGVSLPVPWIGNFWMIATDGMTPATWKKLIRHTRTVLENAAKAIPRIECSVLSTWPESEKFATRFGFMPEGVRRRAGRNGEDIHTLVYQGKT